jgi:poly(ADP-ribose) glycohydrolase
LNIYKYDEQKRAKEYITAIDASVLSKDSVEQYSRKKIEREIMKAYAGFRFHGGGNKIVTGNWGCGAFRGDIRIKLIIQWLACSLTEKELLYCPFG